MPPKLSVVLAFVEFDDWLPSSSGLLQTWLGTGIATARSHKEAKMLSSGTTGTAREEEPDFVPSIRYQRARLTARALAWAATGDTMDQLWPEKVTALPLERVWPVGYCGMI